MKDDYSDPRWKARVETYRASHPNDGCRDCGRRDVRNELHHERYLPYPARIWDSPDEDLALLCRLCHAARRKPRPCPGQRVLPFAAQTRVTPPRCKSTIRPRDVEPRRVQLTVAEARLPRPHSVGAILDAALGPRAVSVEEVLAGIDCSRYSFRRHRPAAGGGWVVRAYWDEECLGSAREPNVWWLSEHERARDCTLEFNRRYRGKTLADIPVEAEPKQ